MSSFTYSVLDAAFVCQEQQQQQHRHRHRQQQQPGQEGQAAQEEQLGLIRVVRSPARTTTMTTTAPSSASAITVVSVVGSTPPPSPSPVAARNVLESRAALSDRVPVGGLLTNTREGVAARASTSSLQTTTVQREEEAVVVCVSRDVCIVSTQHQQQLTVAADAESYLDLLEHDDGRDEVTDSKSEAGAVCDSQGAGSNDVLVAVAPLRAQGPAAARAVYSFPAGIAMRPDPPAHCRPSADSHASRVSSSGGELARQPAAASPSVPAAPAILMLMPSNAGSSSADNVTRPRPPAREAPTPRAVLAQGTVNVFTLL